MSKLPFKVRKALETYRQYKDKGKEDEALIIAIAHLLDIPTVETDVTPQMVLYKLKELNGVNLTTYNAGSFDALSLTISKIRPEVTTKDLDLLYNWLNETGLDWWRNKGITVTWTQVCKLFPQWLVRAREYGQQNNNVGSKIR